MKWRHPRCLKTHCIFLVSSMSWKITQPEDGFLVKRVELGWTCNTYNTWAGNLKKGSKSTHSVASNRPVCSIGNPSCTILLVSVDQTLPQAFSISLTTFYLGIEALHVFFQLRTNWNGARQCPEGKCMRFAPWWRLSVTNKSIVRYMGRQYMWHVGTQREKYRLKEWDGPTKS